MGFYAPAQIVRDAREHGVEARAADINLSSWGSTLEDRDSGGPALRLGLRQIDGLQEEEIGRLVAARAQGAFGSVHDLWQRAGLRLPTLETLAAADAFRSIGLDRRQALWEVTALANAPPLPLFSWSAAHETGAEPEVTLPSMPLSEHVVNDYQTLRLSLKAHPMSFLRERLRAERVSNFQELRSMRDGQFVKVAGVILVRQRPGSAKGVVFMTLEDETGVGNCVVWPKTLERYRKTVMQARLMLVTGRVQRHESIVHVVTTALEDRSDWLLLLSEWANEMPIPIANADEVKSPGSDSSAAGADRHPRWARPETPARPRPMHPRHERIIPKSRDFQ
jgi:error-prone DNA polymerase